MSLSKHKNNHNISLHGARGLAALIVVFSHVGAGGVTEKFFHEMTFALTVFKNILLSGQYGVEIFFMISGYLITASIIRHKSVTSFLVDRCIRLYPVFLPTILLIFILGPFAGYAYFAGFSWLDWVGHLVMNLLFIPGVIPVEAALVVAWSLSYEAVFYLAMSYLKFFNRNKLAQYAFIIFAVIPFLIILPRAWYFVIGIVIYFMVQNGINIKLRLPRMFLVNLFSFLVVLFLLQFPGEVGVVLSQWHIVLLWIVSLLLGYLVFIEIVMQSHLAVLLLKWRWMQFLGTISYSLYIWHTLIMFGTKRIFANTLDVFGSYGAFLLFALVSIILSLLISYLSYVVFEVKIVKLLTSWKRERDISAGAKRVA